MEDSVFVCFSIALLLILMVALATAGGPDYIEAASDAALYVIPSLN